MDIIRAVYSLQQKPIAARRRILAGTVSIIMVTIVGFWLMAASRRIEIDTAQSLTASADKSGESPFEVFKKTAGESWEELQILFK